MAEKNRSELKSYFQAGDRPTEGEFSDLIDSGLNRLDDKASVAESTAGTDDNKFITSLGAKASALQFAPVQSVNGATGDVVIPAVINITGNAATATALQNPRRINGVVFDGTADITLDDSTPWQNAAFEAHVPILTNTAGFSPVRFKKNYGVIFLDGVISGGATQAIGTGYVLFTLPVGFRPASRIVLMCLNLNNTRGRIEIDASGNVYGVVYNSTGLSLSGISFAL